MKRIGTAIATLVLATSSIASARVDVFVHGRNTGTANVSDYWHIGGSDDGVYAFTGNNSEGNYTYGYDASYSYTNMGDNSKPVCQLTQAIWNAPGTDMALITHSAGGPVALYMMAAAQNGWATGCTYSPGSVKQYVTYIITVAAPMRGTEVADAIYGHTSGNWFQSTCGSIAGAIANLAFNQASDMTWALQTSYMNQYWGSITAYGSFSAIYNNGGTSNAGDDSTGLWWAQYCANVEGACGMFCTPSNDGFISQNSANGCVRGTAGGSNCLPGGHRKWFGPSGHSSNRRNNTGNAAANVWAYNPY